MQKKANLESEKCAKERLFSMGMIFRNAPGTKGTPLGDIIRGMNLEDCNELTRSETANTGKTPRFERGF